MNTVQDTDERESQTEDESESDLQKRLKRVEFDTLDGRQCRAEITDIEEVRSDKIRLTVELPSGREHSERFDLPEVASEEYAFVRLLKRTGYGLSALDHAVGADVTVEITDSGPQIVVPEPDRTAGERLTSALGNLPWPVLVAAGVSLFVITAPATSPSIYRRIHEDKWGWEPYRGEVIFQWLWVTLFWLLTVGVGLAVLLEAFF